MATALFAISVVYIFMFYAAALAMNENWWRSAVQNELQSSLTLPSLFGQQPIVRKIEFVRYFLGEKTVHMSTFLWGEFVFHTMQKCHGGPY